MTDNIDWNAPAIAPEVGKRYVLRDGRVTGKMRRLSDQYGFEFIAMHGSDLLSWNKDGFYLPSGGPNSSDIIEEYKENDETKRDERIHEALDIAMRYGGIHGDYHKAWVIDQMVRALTGCVSGTKMTKYVYGVEYEALAERDEYREFVRAACDGEDGPDTYSWNVGVAP